MNSNQQLKRRFRASKAWRFFRLMVKKHCKNKDVLTLRPLLTGFQCHHLDQREENYTKIDDETRFITLNKQSHDVVHFIWRYYVKDETIIDRLKNILDDMKQKSND